MRHDTAHRLIEAFFVTLAMIVALGFSALIFMGIALFCKILEGS